MIWISKTLQVTGMAILGIILVLVIWQPVLPSGWIIQRMAGSINPEDFPAGPPMIVRFSLSGKGGGVYNILAGPDGVEVVMETADPVDLIMYMEAGDFNRLMISLARGTADEYTFQSLIVSKVLRFAGDMTVLEKLFDPKGVK